MLVYLASIAYLVIRKNKEGSHLIALSEVREENPTLPRQDIASMQLPPTRTTDDLWSETMILLSFRFFEKWKKERNEW